MKPQRRFQFCLALLSCVAMLSPLSFLQATAPETAKPNTSASYSADIALTACGVLRGSVVDSQGSIVANSQVAVMQNGKVIAEVMTNKQGDFEAGGLLGGVYVVTTPEAAMVCRLWSGNTAPPAAHDRLLLINEGTVVRGQYNAAYALGDWMSDHPAITYCSLGAVIAVPIIIADTNDDPPAS